LFCASRAMENMGVPVCFHKRTSFTRIFLCVSKPAGRDTFIDWLNHTPSEEAINHHKRKGLLIFN